MHLEQRLDEIATKPRSAGTAAMLFRSGDAEDLRRKLSLLIEEAPFRLAYTEAAYPRVQRAYNSDVALNAYVWAFGL
jgi:hypothetical protein